MKFKHIAYIHNLLVMEELKARRLYEAANGAYLTAEEFDLDSLEDDRRVRDDCYKEWSLAKDVLATFEAREW